MITIESIKGHAEVRYVLVAVVLLLAASAVLVYDYSRATGGGTAVTRVRERSYPTETIRSSMPREMRN